MANMSLADTTNVGQCLAQLITVSHVSSDVRPSNLATTSYRPKGRRGYSDKSLSGR